MTLNKYHWINHNAIFFLVKLFEDTNVGSIIYKSSQT
jgi:hypothetical protein